MDTTDYYRRTGMIVCALLLIATLASSVTLAQRSDSRRSLFDYDRSAALDLKEVSSRDQDGVSIRDINYAAYNPKHKRIDAYLVTPKRKGRFAGVLFFHWLGENKSDRNEFLDEAIALAKEGTTSLLIQGNFPWLEAPTEAQADRRQIVDQTIEVRRALDLLLSQPQVDRRRIGFVGHDYGAMYGSIISGIEKRVKAYVFVAATPGFSEWSLKYWPVTAKAGEEIYRQAMKELDPINYVSHAAPAALFFQFAKSDKYIPRATALTYFKTASRPKQIRWYDTIHEMNVEAARKDRRAWLTRQLRLPLQNRER
jgi:cephalosporin-C deacetylase-like acetyl esterase